MTVSILYVAYKGADWLRHTLPRSKKAFPASPIVVVTCPDDHATIALAAAFRVTVVTVDTAILTSNSAAFNYAALARAGQAKLIELGADWIITTRSNVVVDESIAAIKFDSLDKLAVYGSFFKEFEKPVDLLRYVSTGPTSEDVRAFMPRSEFLMFHASSGNRFGAWSSNTRDAEIEFTSKFASQFMIQTKLAHLGKLDTDTDVRVSPEYVAKDVHTHVAPVHPGAVETSQKEVKPVAQKPVGKVSAPRSKGLDARFGAIEGKSTLPIGRREIDTQQIRADSPKDVVDVPVKPVKHTHFKPVAPL